VLGNRQQWWKTATTCSPDRLCFGAGTATRIERTNQPLEPPPRDPNRLRTAACGRERPNDFVGVSGLEADTPHVDGLAVDRQFASPGTAR